MTGRLMDAAAAVVPICTGCGEVCSYAGCREAGRHQEKSLEEE
jgi:hypothetical protein